MVWYGMVWCGMVGACMEELLWSIQQKMVRHDFTVMFLDSISQLGTIFLSLCVSVRVGVPRLHRMNFPVFS